MFHSVLAQSAHAEPVHSRAWLCGVIFKFFTLVYYANEDLSFG